MDSHMHCTGHTFIRWLIRENSGHTIVKAYAMTDDPGTSTMGGYTFTLVSVSVDNYYQSIVSTVLTSDTMVECADIQSVERAVIGIAGLNKIHRIMNAHAASTCTGPGP